MDLIQRCLSENPQSRPTAEAALEHHPFLKRKDLAPDETDMTALPTSIIRVKSGEQQPNLEEIKREASKHGAVSSVEVRNGFVFVEFCGPEVR